MVEYDPTEEIEIEDIPLEEQPTGAPASRRDLKRLEPATVAPSPVTGAGFTTFEKVQIGIFLICSHITTFMLGMKWFT